MPRLNRILLDPNEDDATGGVPTDGEQQTATPTTEEKIVDFEDFLNPPVEEENPTEPEGEVKTDGETEGEVKTVEEKKEKDAEKAEEVVPEKPTIAQRASEKSAASRDFSGLPQDTVPLFQKMSNEAFNHLKPFYLEALQTKQQLEETRNQLKQVENKELPQNYYEHPSAFVLSPDYAQAAQNAQLADSVLEHWRSQLDAIRGGATEYQTLVKDPSTGQLVIGGNAKVEAGTQSRVEQIFFAANQQANQWRGKLSQVQESFQSKHQQAVNDLRNFEDSFFKVFKDEKHPLQAAVKDTLSKMNPAFRANPLASFVAKSYVTINALTDLLAKQKSGAKTNAAKIAEAQKAAGPLETGAGGSVAKKGSDVSIEDFEKVMGD